MSDLLLDDPALLARLAPYARHAVGEAARFARKLHAEEVAPEHLLSSLMFDEDCAASRVVIHAFADPETIATEVLALCPGITVVGSARCLPFSVRGVELLFAARAGAAAVRSVSVEPAHLFAAAAEHLDTEARSRLTDAGFSAAPPAAAPAAGAEGEAVAEEGPLFRSFSTASKRVLGAAGNAAARFERDAIAPAHVLLGCLEIDEALRDAAGLTVARTRMLLSDRDADPTPPPRGSLPAGAELAALLARTAADADTLGLLGAILDHGASELRQLLTRQKVTAAVVGRCLGVFQDPDPPGPI